MTVSRVKVEVSGPLFDARGKAAIRAFMDEAKKDVAEVGLQLTRQTLGQKLKNPTGAYLSAVTTRVERLNDVVVTDQGAVYGPWLEAGKYTPPRRFKGYSAFRRARLQVRKMVPVIVHGSLTRTVRRLGG